MAISKSYRLVFSDLSKNSYKYYDAELHDDGRVISRFGAVGSTPQECDYGVKGEAFLNKKIKEKEKKGYTHAKVITHSGVSAPNIVQKSTLADIALSQIKYSNESVKSLIKRLADSNVHKITASTSITFDSSSGLFQTPLGIVTQEAIDEARAILPAFTKLKRGGEAYKDKIDTYLRLIPRNKGHKLSYDSVFPDLTAIQKESDLLDALENSLAIVSKPTAPKDGSTPKVEQVFNLKLDRLNDDKERNRILEWYAKSNKAMHNYTSVKVREIYEMDVEDYNRDFDEKVGNITEVWHGSGQSNILSIAKVGLKCSPPSTAAIAGKMFGNGVYGSKTASKSLGYTLGRWGQGSGDSGWLFVCEFAMGTPYYPTRATHSIPAGHDSCWALPEKTGLLNDELIVYREKQIRIRYLLEVK